jgi:NAD(P)-dependent dehydrogenase (short-subunit alcohol dehydrogenase family)
MIVINNVRAFKKNDTKCTKYSKNQKNKEELSMNRLKGKIAVITGGNSGVGAATAKLFAAEGATVVITARREAALKEVADEITAAGGEVYAVSTDISKPEDPEMLMQKVMDKYGKIDILVNNAGILEQGLKPIDKFLDEDMDRIIETNEKGTMRCMRAASKRMTTGGAIVNVASVAGEKGCGGAAYVASKAAVIGLTKHTALRFQKDGIRCNAICPGNIITPMTMGTDPKALDPDMIGAMMTHSDIKAQSCTAEDVANVVLFFASDEARAITGQIIVTDFGAML